MTVYEVEAPPEVFTEREQRARTLEAAALEIEVRGWAKCDYDERTGGVCANGAIAFALGLDVGTIKDTKPALVHALRDGPWLTGQNHPYSQIARFNDYLAESSSDAAFLLRWRAEEIRDGWDA